MYFCIFSFKYQTIGKRFIKFIVSKTANFTIISTTFTFTYNLLRNLQSEIASVLKNIYTLHIIHIVTLSIYPSVSQNISQQHGNLNFKKY